MEQIDVDARGRSCPEPVILVQQAMKNHPAALRVVVDNSCAVENITRFVQHQGRTLCETQQGDEYLLEIAPKP